MKCWADRLPQPIAIAGKLTTKIVLDLVLKDLSKPRRRDMLPLQRSSVFTEDNIRRDGAEDEWLNIGLVVDNSEQFVKT